LATLGLWAAVGLWVPATAAAASASPTPPQQQLAEALTHPGLRGAQLGVAVQRLDSGAPVYAQGGDSQLIPASNIKLITSAAALCELGADYQFKTELLGTLGPAGQILGDLTVVGYGDPYLLPERVTYLAARLYFMGVHHIQGDLVLDDSYFAADTRMALGWQEDRTSHAYMAPAGALSVGFNAVMVHVLPGLGQSPKARVMTDPQQAYARIQGQIATVEQGSTRINVDVLPQGRSSVVRVSGQINRSDPGRAYWRRIDNPPIFAGEVLRQALERQGITVAGKVRAKKAAPDSPLLLTALSPRLAELIGPLNKYSNNFMAMQVALALGAHRYGAPATWDKAARALHSFMADRVGIAPNSYTLSNASGLHSVNRLSAKQLVRVLAHMHAEPTLAYEFVGSLAVAAGSGTLQDRMLGGPAAHLLRAKTGTLTRASALSGYITTHEGVPLVFSMLVNNYRHIADVWAAQDTFAEALACLKLAPSSSTGPLPLPLAEESGPP
jgi:D-alanyl-D-alanine carboxypeptidase/D-alanyl-D-alanine-endopeptidase (penicillin-binding protein 4)